MLHAQIKNNVVKNIIVTSEATNLSLFSVGFDLLIRVDELPVVPDIGSTYDGSTFTPPPPLARFIPKSRG